ncbi:MAG: beta-ketoacyl-[acyl-carrier-protein] synthase family protein [Candidatus Omnitrophica bacterium]|nr:beta-ketoacyl-[acyl-carrier-protein] synthase family protein [Candidatus Omnitrophota bacterium]
MKGSRRVVITGIGIVSSLGIGKDIFWKNIINGVSGISEVTSFDTSAYKCHMGGEVKNFVPEDFMPKRKVKFLGKTSQLAIAASSLALKDANIPIKAITSDKFGVVIGTTLGERSMEESAESWAKGGIKDLNIQKLFQAAVNNISSNVGIQFKARGLNYLIPNACAAGNYAIGYGYDLIKNGDLNFALAGGSESFSHVAFAGFQRLYAMSADKCAPFDKNRKGMILGEGSGMLFLESLESALKRGAGIYAEVLGYGLSCDAYNATASDVKGIVKVMQKALKDANVNCEDIDYICAHGTGTLMNDKTEAMAINEIFGQKNKGVLVSSLKSMLGHTMGASSAIEAAACCLAIRDGIVPPTINFETPDPECDIDCVPNKARKKKITTVLNNGFAFGGNNCCVVFGEVNSW